MLLVPYVDDPKYRFKLRSDWRIWLPGLADRPARDFKWMRLDHLGRMTIREGYAWNGCDPAFRIGRRWIGTPTPESLMVPSLVHDALCQFGRDPKATWTRQEADIIFFELMHQNQFPASSVYYGAVRLLGPLWAKIPA